MSICSGVEVSHFHYNSDDFTENKRHFYIIIKAIMILLHASPILLISICVF